MSSRSDAQNGAQAPRHSVRPRGGIDTYDGEEAVALAAGYGLTPDPWQASVVGGWLARTKDGKLAAGRCGLAVPRQNGKNGAVEVAQLHKLVVQARRILHTAHEVKTARKAFLRLCSFFENERRYPELAELVREIRRTNGQEAIFLHNGASVEFVARSRGSGRGFTVDDLFCDEAQELSDEQLEALLPTIAAAPSGDPQIVFLGTPPPPGAGGAVFRRVRMSAVSGGADRLAWDEWSIADDTEPAEAVRQWRKLALATNPALGRRLNITTITDEVAAMSPEGFARERLGWWSPAATGVKAFAPSAWNVLEGARPADARVAYGVKFTADGSGVGLAVAHRPEQGPVYVEPLRQANLGEGIDWLVDYLAERHSEAAQIVIDGRAGVGYLVNALRDAGARNKRLIIVPNLEQVTSAHSMFEQAVLTGGLTHPGDAAFTEQVLAATKRQIGRDGGFAWAAPEDGTVVALDAATFALWGVKTTTRRPGRKATFL